VGSGGATANSDLGRRTKEQKTAQRPAIRVRLRLLQGVRIKLPGTFIAPLPACDLPLYLNFASQLQRAVLKGIMSIVIGLNGTEMLFQAVPAVRLTIGRNQFAMPASRQNLPNLTGNNTKL
jgi:hypothetical protein